MGEQVNNDEINVEWPTQEMFDKMPEGIYLQKLELMPSSYQLDYIAGVRCTLSNNQQSPIYTSEGACK